ncbi:MAG: helix-turn-helix transcriptional regulator [Clostridia bacterium]|nr:helix-turn-helix transcriptional regulator [Clostridia bacterium]
MLSAALKSLKESRKMTNREISELSGIPESTLARIFSGQTDNPSFQSVCDIVTALDGSLDEIAGIRHKKCDMPHMCEHHNELIEHYQSELDTKNKWLLRLFVICLCLVAVLILLLAVDIVNSDFGVFRG